MCSVDLGRVLDRPYSLHGVPIVHGVYVVATQVDMPSGETCLVIARFQQYKLLRNCLTTIPLVIDHVRPGSQAVYYSLRTRSIGISYVDIKRIREEK